MKCTNKLLKFIAVIIMASLFSACSESAEIRVPFSTFIDDYSIHELTLSDSVSVLNGFSKNLCTFTDDNLDLYKPESVNAGLLIDISSNEVLYSENAFEKVYPASITKILTAYVALKYCDLDEEITCTSNVSKLRFSDAVSLGLKKGDILTVDQALNLALLASYNDVANAIAEHVSGSIEAFAELSNKEARALGATGTYFVNPHGLPDDNHYTTAYDLYLIFNAALQNPKFLEIIQSTDYSTRYHDKNDKDITAIAKNTNLFIRGTYELPEGVTVIGGKTGTTTDAGYCLLMLVEDASMNQYIAMILGANSRENLYGQMSELLSHLSN